MIVIANILISRFFKLPLHNSKSSSLFFMKNKSVLWLAASCLMVLGGCKDSKPEYGAPMQVRVFDVAGRSDFRPDQRMGLFVSDPVGADNVPFTVGANGAIITDKDIKWGFDQSHSSRFFAYSPYNSSFSGKETVDVNIPTDQSSAEKMLNSDMLKGISSGGPQDKSVKIRMEHALTAMTVFFDNRSGERISEVAVYGFMTTGQLNIITGELKATTGKKAITPMRSDEDENSFAFVYLPQDVTPLFRVTLSSGKVMSYTFDNYCHEYPGKVIRMKVLIQETDTEANILELSGVSISQWNTNGLPVISQNNQFMYLKDLVSIEPDEKQNGFFSAYLNKVTVTAVDNTYKDILGVIIEDSTKAIHVWTNYDSKLKPGNTVSGPILGLMDKPGPDEFHISFFHTDYATIGKTDVLPCTEGRFSSLAEYIKTLEYRRMVFRDVVLEKGFSNGRAVFVQDTTRISVVCPDLSISLTEGVKGDLTGFPVRSGGEVIIMVYDENDLMSLSKEQSDNALTRSEAYGLYDITNPDTALYMISGKEEDIQYSVRYFDYGQTMQVSDTGNGEIHTFLVWDVDGTFLVGHEYEVSFNVLGKSSQNGSTLYMECIKVDEKTVWLADRSGKLGLVLAL